jgi:hypothetical protein
MDHKNDEQWSYADHLLKIACGVSEVIFRASKPQSSNTTLDSAEKER